MCKQYPINSLWITMFLLTISHLGCWHIYHIEDFKYNIVILSTINTWSINSFVQHNCHQLDESSGNIESMSLHSVLISPAISVFLILSTSISCRNIHYISPILCCRYLAIFYPQTSRISPRTACIMIAIIWLVPMCIFIPWLVVYVEKVFIVQGFPYVQCTAEWSSMDIRKMYILGAVFLTCYLIPLLFIAVFYLLIGIKVWKRNVRGIRGSRAERNINRSKIRILRMLIVVFVMFALSWLPLYAIELRILFGTPPLLSEKILLKNYLLPIAQWLGASNSCVNPFIYCYFSTNFRGSIVQIFRSRTCCGKITTWGHLCDLFTVTYILTNQKVYDLCHVTCMDQWNITN